MFYAICFHYYYALYGNLTITPVDLYQYKSNDAEIKLDGMVLLINDYLGLLKKNMHFVF